MRRASSLATVPNRAPWPILAEGGCHAKYCERLICAFCDRPDPSTFHIAGSGHQHGSREKVLCMAIRAHPLAMPGKPYAQAERDFFRQCAEKNGRIEYTDASSALYEPKPALRTEDVRTSTLLHMETLNMERAAPILIRIYKEGSTLEVWKQDRNGKFALLGAYPICKFSDISGRRSSKGITKRRKDFMTLLQTR